MVTVLAILGTIALIVLTMGIVLIALFVCRALQESAVVYDRAHNRWVKQLEKVQDKLLAHSWEEYVGIRSLEDENQGGWSSPQEANEAMGEDEGEVEQLVPSRFGGFMSGDAFPRPDADTEILLAEDFDEEGEPVRRIPG